MASVASEAAVASLQGEARAQARGTVDAVAVAWLCAVPCAAIVAVLMFAVGPSLAELLPTAHGQFTFLDVEGTIVQPEPTEHARYLIALTAPLLATLAIVLGTRRQLRVPDRLVGIAIRATQLLLAGIVVAALVVQPRLLFGSAYNTEVPFHLWYFTSRTVAVGVLLGAVAAALALSGRVHVLRDAEPRRWIVTAVALAATAIWILPAVASDASIANAPEELLYHLQFPFDETFAVLNGRTPLVDFTAQYSSLWPFVIALPMAAFGKTLLAFTIATSVIGTLALLAVFGVLRRVTHSSLAALLLYLPILASSLFLIGGALDNRSSVGTYFGTFPLRYAGPWFVAWLTARQLDGRERPTASSLWLLFTIGGLVLLNNGDFGLAAVGASVAALLWTSDRLDRRTLTRLAGPAAGGLATALALVSVLTLARSGSLPQLARLLDYARLYTIGGYGLEPIPGVLGVHLLIYLTYVAAIAVATVRAVQGAANRVLTGMLAWAGIFGLGAFAYYVGRSHPVALKHQFGAWSFALALLTIVALRTLAARPVRRTTIVGALVVLFGFSVMACSLAQTPTPWSQLSRLNAPFTPRSDWRSPRLFEPPKSPSARAFVASLADGSSRFVYRRGAPVAILLTTGHRVADAYGVVNVSPYTGIESLQTVQRVETALDALRAAGGNTVIVPITLDTSIFRVFARRGFDVLTPAGLRPYVAGRTTPHGVPWPIVGSIMKWVDMRHLHPRALG